MIRAMFLISLMALVGCAAEAGGPDTPEGADTDDAAEAGSFDMRDGLSGGKRVLVGSVRQELNLEEERGRDLRPPPQPWAPPAQPPSPGDDRKPSAEGASGGSGDKQGEAK